MSSQRASPHTKHDFVLLPPPSFFFPPLTPPRPLPPFHRQDSIGLPASGVCDARTWAALLKPGAKPSDIAEYAASASASSDDGFEDDMSQNGSGEKVQSAAHVQACVGALFARLCPVADNVGAPVGGA